MLFYIFIRRPAPGAPLPPAISISQRPRSIKASNRFLCLGAKCGCFDHISLKMPPRAPPCHQRCLQVDTRRCCPMKGRPGTGRELGTTPVPSPSTPLCFILQELRQAIRQLGLSCMLGVQPCTPHPRDAPAPTMPPHMLQLWNSKQVGYLAENILLLKVLYSGFVTLTPTHATLYLVPTFSGTLGHLRHMAGPGRSRTFRVEQFPELPWLNTSTAPAHVFLETSDRSWLPRALFQGLTKRLQNLSFRAPSSTNKAFPHHIF